MHKSIKKKALTILELVIMIAIIAILAALLTPRAKVHFEESRRVGVDRNRTLLETLVRNEYEKPYFETETEDEVIDRIYQNLSKNQDLKDMKNPFNKKNKEVGFIKGNIITDKNNAGYVLTEEPNKEDLSKGDVYVVIKNNQITTGTGEGTPENPSNEDNQFTVTDNVSFNYRTSVLRYDGKIYVFGNNTYKQSGLENPGHLLYPTIITSLQDGVKPLSIAISSSHSLAIGNDGNMYTWGYNGSGQLGLGDFATRLSPTLINLPNGVKPISIHGGNNHSLALGNDGNLYAWGDNNEGVLGTGDLTERTVPTLVNLPNGVKPKSIPTGFYHTLVIGDDGNLYSWGDNYGGALGNGDTTSSTIPILVPLPGGIKPTSIAAGAHHSLIIGDDGNLYTWGLNGYGQLGLGDKVNRLNPTLVNLPNGVKPKSIAAGIGTSLVIGDDGNLYTWGENDDGQLGTGDKISKLIPTLVNLPNEVKPKSITAGYTHTIVIGDDENIYTCGYNLHGQLGLGHTNTTTIPTLITQFN